LRSRLKGGGHTFRSKTDTEVLLHHYEDRGAEFIHDIDGMFGLAIWDSRRHRLVLAPDRMGKKPLYYYDDGTRFLFASELKALLDDRSVPRTLELDSLAEYLSFG